MQSLEKTLTLVQLAPFFMLSSESKLHLIFSHWLKKMEATSLGTKKY
jgi:hypothetical protein